MATRSRKSSSDSEDAGDQAAGELGPPGGAKPATLFSAGGRCSAAIRRQGVRGERQHPGRTASGSDQRRRDAADAARRRPRPRRPRSWRRRVRFRPGDALDGVGPAAPAAGDPLDDLVVDLGALHRVVAGEVEVPELGGPTAPRDVEPGEVAAAAAAPAGPRVGQVGHHVVPRLQSRPLACGVWRQPIQPIPRGEPILSVAASSVFDMSTHVERRSRGPAARWESQRTFDELGRPLRDVTFCVVDLETTGGSAAGGSMITEIGAVKVRGGEVLGEFQTLVNPHQAIPPFIAVLTGITDSHGRGRADHRPGAPRLPRVRAGLRPGRAQRAVRRGLPQALRARPGSALAALRGARHRVPGPPSGHPRRDAELQAELARPGSSAPRRHPTTARSRDARATVDVLHGLIERLGNLGVQTLEELQTYTSRVTPAQRRKRHLAEHLPHAPGVYLFRDDRRSGPLRRHVEGPPDPGPHATSPPPRPAPGWVRWSTLAHRVDGIVCATPLEAHIRELRLIAEHKPKFNRRSRFPERVHWVKLTVEPWPRLSLVRRVIDDGADYLGPVLLPQGRRTRGRRAARDVPGAAVRRPPPRAPGAQRLRARGDGPVPLPLQPGASPQEDYAEMVDAAPREHRRVPRASVVGAAGAAHGRCWPASSGSRRPAGSATGSPRSSAAPPASQRLKALTRCPEIVAARKEDGRWAVHVVRHGRLAAAGVIPSGADAMRVGPELQASAETVLPGPGPLPASTAEETELLLRWLESDGVRLVHVDGEWTCPVGGATRHLALHDAVEASRRSLVAVRPVSAATVGR